MFGDEYFFGSLYLATHKNQLEAEQNGLQTGHNNDTQREPRKPLRIVGDPLRLEGDLGINRRFFGVDARPLCFFLFFFIGLGLCFWSGGYFYNKRYLFGAALSGIGLLFAVVGWGILFLGWLL